MKWSVILYGSLTLFAICSCDYDHNKKGVEKFSLANQNADTLYSDEVLREYRKELMDYKSTLKLEYLDENDNRIKGFHSNDTLHLRVVYYSQKFPMLNEDYNIILDPISKNFNCRKLKRNKFELFINPNTEMIEFDLYLSCKGVVFKYSSLDKENNLTYELRNEVGLSRFYEPVSR